MYPKREGCYLYVQRRPEIEGTVTLWARRSAWVDEAVVGCFKQKLLATLDTSAWKQAIDETQRGMERERKLKRLQLGSLTDEMQNLVVSLKTLTHPTLIQEV